MREEVREDSGWVGLGGEEMEEGGGESGTSSSWQLVLLARARARPFERNK